MSNFKKIISKIRIEENKTTKSLSNYVKDMSKAISFILEGNGEIMIHPFTFEFENTRNIFCIKIQEEMIIKFLIFRDAVRIIDFNSENFYKYFASIERSLMEYFKEKLIISSMNNTVINELSI